MKPDVSKMLEDAAGWRSKIQAKTRNAGSWYSISNAAEDRATIRIYDEISWFGVDAQTFASELEEITASEIEVAINSPGGSVFDGLAIFNALRTHPAKIITRVDGLAASAASFIAQAGDERIMVDSSQMMIHDAWGYMAGNAAEFREYADFLEQQSENIAALYAARAESDDHDTDHYSQMMADETWLNAADAVSNGLADRVLTPERQKTDGDTENKFTPVVQNVKVHDVATVMAAIDALKGDPTVSTEAPEQTAADAAVDAPAAHVASTPRSDLARVSQLAILTDAERSEQ